MGGCVPRGGTRCIENKRSAGETYGLEGVRATKPEIVVPRTHNVRAPAVVVRRSEDTRALMVRNFRGIRITGVEATLVTLGAVLGPEAFEVACEDDKWSVPARFGFCIVFATWRKVTRDPNHFLAELTESLAA